MKKDIAGLLRRKLLVRGLSKEIQEKIEDALERNENRAQPREICSITFTDFDEKSVINFTEIAVESIKKGGCFLDYAKEVINKFNSENYWAGDWGNLYLLLKDVWEDETKTKINDCQDGFYKIYEKDYRKKD